jgi:hypothetical protein
MHFWTGFCWTGIFGFECKWNEPQHTMSGVTKNFIPHRLNRTDINVNIATFNKHSSLHTIIIITIIIIIIIIIIIMEHGIIPSLSLRNICSGTA